MQMDNLIYGNGSTQFSISIWVIQFIWASKLSKIFHMPCQTHPTKELNFTTTNKRPMQVSSIGDVEKLYQNGSWKSRVFV